MLPPFSTIFLTIIWSSRNNFKKVFNISTSLIWLIIAVCCSSVTDGQYNFLWLFSFYKFLVIIHHWNYMKKLSTCTNCFISHLLEITVICLLIRCCFVDIWCKTVLKIWCLGYFCALFIRTCVHLRRSVWTLCVPVVVWILNNNHGWNCSNGAGRYWMVWF